MKKFTEKQLIAKYATEKQKATYKEKGAVSSGQWKVIIAYVEKDYDSVVVEGRGKNRIIVCTGLKNDKRKENGNNGNSNINHLEKPIECHMIAQSYADEECRLVPELSARQHLKRMGLLDQRLLNIAYDGTIADTELLNVMKSYKGIFEEKDAYLIRDFAIREISDLTEQWKKALVRMEKEKILRYRIAWAVKIIGSSETRVLTREEENLFFEIEAAAHEEANWVTDNRIDIAKHVNIPLNQLVKNSSLYNAKKTYEVVFSNLLKEHFNAEYAFKTYYIKLIQSKRVLDKYMKWCEEEFEEKIQTSTLNLLAETLERYHKRSLKNAKSRQKRKNKREDGRTDDASIYLFKLKETGDYAKKWDYLLKFFAAIDESKEIDK